MSAARTVDIDLACWFCAHPFARDDVEANGHLVPRRRGEGGPFLLYACPACARTSRVERNRAGALLAGPRPIVPLVDPVLAAFDGELRAELEKKREHERRRGGRREWFFGPYAEELWAAGIRPTTAGTSARPAPEPPPGPGPGPEAAEEEPRPPPAADRRPDPHEVLGLERGATREDAVRAFRELAKRYHPDRFEVLDEEFKALAHHKFLEIKAALDAFEG